MGKDDSLSSHLQKTVADNIKQRRLRLGMSQEEFAEKCGYHRTYIGSIERGERNITLQTLQAIADALEVEPYILVSSDD